MYIYNGIVTKVYDGDTITMDIDLGLGVWVRGEKIRLYGINAPEIRGAEREQGAVSRDALRQLIYGQKVRLKTYKDKTGKYGRYIGTIHLITDSKPLDISRWMVENGYAVWKDYD